MASNIIGGKIGITGQLHHPGAGPPALPASGASQQLRGSGESFCSVLFPTFCTFSSIHACGRVVDGAPMSAAVCEFEPCFLHYLLTTGPNDGTNGVRRRRDSMPWLWCYLTLLPDTRDYWWAPSPCRTPTSRARL